MLNKIRQWAQGSVNRKIVAGSVFVAGLSLASKLIILYRERLVAGVFGTSLELDTFIVVFSVVSFVANTLIVPSTFVVIPNFIKVRQLRGDAVAWTLVNKMAAAVGLVALGIAVLLALFAGPVFSLVGAKLGQEAVEIGTQLLLLMLPVLVLNSVVQLMAAVLNAFKVLWPGAIGPIWIALGQIGMILLVIGSGIFTLAYGSIVGVVVEFAILFAALKFVGWRPAWLGESLRAEFKTVSEQYLYLMTSSALMGGTMIVDQLIATLAGPGGVSTLTFGSRLPVGLVNLLATALSTAMFPHLAELYQAGDVARLRHTCRKFTLVILAFSIPLCGVLIAISTPLVSFFFENGKFGAENVLEVSRVQVAYFCHIPFYLLMVIYTRLISAASSNRWIAYVSGASLVLNAALDWLFLQWWGLPGIAWSTVCVFVVIAAATGVGASRVLNRMSARH